MKKYFLSIGAVALLLSACNQLENAIVEPQEGISQTITTTFAETRTTVDNDWTVSWKDEDKMDVYVTRSSSSNYNIGSSRFTYSNGGTFTGTVNSKFANPWNWFAIYPSTLSKDGTSTSCSVTVTHPATQTMSGSSKSHIAGSNDPLFGYALGVKENPAIKMHHIASVIDFHITNGNGQPITVTKIEFTAPESITGPFKATISLGDGKVDNPSWSAASGASKTVTLNVENGAQTAAGASSDFYATIHPISQSGSYKIKVTANVGGLSLTSEKTISANLSFTAGKIKTVNFTFKADLPDPYDIENSKLKAYLDAVEASPYFTNNTFGKYDNTYYKSSLMSTGKYYDGNSSSNRLDQPNPVTLSWNGNATKVTVYSSSSKTAQNKVAEVSVSNTTSAKVYNLIPGHKYYYTASNSTSTVDTGDFTPKGRRRMLRVSSTYDAEHACNCRDFGGLPTVDGKKLKYGMIYRGSNIDGLPNDASAKDVFLNTMKIKWDIDLRDSGEKNNAPTFDGVSKGTQSYYPSFDDSNLKSKTKVSQTMKEIINAVNKGEPVYIHCRIGSDRTGYICMLVEALLGVTQNYCDTDYEITSFASKVTSVRFRIGNEGGGMYQKGITYIGDQNFAGETLHDKVYTFVTSSNGLNISKSDVDKFIANMKE